MATTHAVVTVYPYPLTNLSVTDGTSTITIGNGITDSGSYYSFDIGTGYTLGCTDLTFSTDNYLSFEIYCGTDTVHEITMIKTMYAWGIESSGSITGPYVYTFSETPTSGDKVFEYNNNIFEEYGTVYTFSNNVLGFRYWAGKSDDYYRASSQDIITFPENLYGWTDNELTDTTYYAWYNPSSDSVANRRIFSLYENPKINDTVWVFSYNANRTSYDISEATETTIISTVPGTGAVNSVALNSNGTLYLQTSTMGGITCERASSWDMTVANPLKTVYTDSTTLTNGMSIYDNTGTDIGYVVGNISNNSFDRCVTLTFTFGGSQSSYFDGTLTVNGNSVLYSDTVYVPYNQSCTIVATRASKGISMAINGSEVIFDSSPVSYTFTPMSNTIVGLSETDGKY